MATGPKPVMEPVIARRHLFSSAHFYNQPLFSKERNLEVFGRCYTEHGHGHNYVVEAFVRGAIDANSLLVMDVVILDEILKDVCDPLDHHHLNFDVPEFKETIPTTENIALYLFARVGDRLYAKVPEVKLERLRLYETDDLWAEIIA